jgi:uncharacterized membrane protein
MWSRRELKERAKNVLRWNYWKAFLISLVILVAEGGGGGSGGRSGSRSGGQGGGMPFLNNFSMRDAVIFGLVALAAVAFLLLIAAALRIFLGYPLEVGGRKYFIQSAQNFDNRRCFRFAFDGQNYMGIVATMFLKGIFNFLWFLLFIIPGIVKAYSYSMVPYILADNPNIGAAKAIRLSNKMTYGHKFDMFVLDLSFIGWYLLGMLALFVGMLFVKPYENATKAELYLVLRRNALESGMCSYQELMLQDPAQEGYNW